MENREIWTTAQRFVRLYGQAAIFEAMRLAHRPNDERAGTSRPEDWRLVAFAASQILESVEPHQRPH
ncbi:hypothetical protein [Arenibaculum sp.]|jgi:hypothetical protein|uniref:hypothetical protein n=1 Tax=Arenibaculum sp. TaxID=2865862 RepID=UPI002E15BCBF|nr:hypothetical protein [Arenibaculum sp.]